jgi:hypothetical protein
MRKLILIALILAVFAGGVSVYATYQRQYIVSQAAQSEMIGLRQSLGGVEAANALGSNGAYIALDRSMFDKLSSAMTRQSVSLNAKQLGEDINITVNAASVQPDTGRMALHLHLSAASPKRGLTVGLEVDGFVYFAGITEETNSSDGTIDAANFKFLPVSVVPRLQFGFLNLRGRKFVSDTMTSGVLSLMFNQLAWKIAYRPHLSFSYDSPSTITQHFGQDNAESLVEQIDDSRSETANRSSISSKCSANTCWRYGAHSSFSDHLMSLPIA